ncbi:hypothetical protein [Xanthobacter sp. KR7-225]|uniref:hypothetical protein n=1 Tax=Xanthobacter sp. KR7-225 TaxID=3156613 RepID=UPI0032B5202A
MSRPAHLPPAVHLTTVDEFFARYTRIAKRAQATHSLADGIAAGRAWRDFLDAFTSEGDDEAEGVA